MQRGTSSIGIAVADEIGEPFAYWVYVDDVDPRCSSSPGRVFLTMSPEDIVGWAPTLSLGLDTGSIAIGRVTLLKRSQEEPDDPITSTERDVATLPRREDGPIRERVALGQMEAGSFGSRRAGGPC